MTTIAPLDYDALRARVAGLLESGTARARAVVDGGGEKARTYWEVGGLLNEQLGGRAGYGDQMIGRLAGDLGVNRAILYRAMRFHRRLPNVATWRHLSWSHCRALITVPEDRALEDLLERSVTEQWTVRQLESHIREEVPRRQRQAICIPPRPVPARPVVASLQPRRGEPFTYRLVSSIGPGGDEDLALDLGFRVRRPLTQLGLGGKQSRKLARAGLGPEDAVSLVDGKGGPKLRPAAVGRERLFTYAAALGRVVGGDALELELELDLGLGNRIVQKVRLRGIDAAELGGQAGQRARAFVEERLRVAALVVKTFRPDKYDRYLADVFYRAGETDARAIAAEGTFLNGEILREELTPAHE